MTDYKKLVEALRHCVNARNCKKCGYRINNNSVKCRIQRVEDAAAAIEALQAEVDALEETLKAVQKNSGINFRMLEEAERKATEAWNRRAET